MKHFQILLLLALMLMNINLFAQFFTNASATEYSATNTNGGIVPRITGNDVMNLGSNWYSVSVWDDPSIPAPELAFRVQILTNTYSGHTALAYTDITEADVCLIEDGTNVFAIVVYIQGATPTYYWEEFQWIGSGTNAFVSNGATSFTSGTTSTTLNIESDNGGRFAIVWDDATPNVWIKVGSMSGGAPTTPAGCSSAFVSGSSPDVSIVQYNLTTLVVITYLQSGDLKVGYETYSDIAGNSCSINVMWL